jgi:hypothetical protein
MANRHIVQTRTASLQSKQTCKLSKLNSKGVGIIINQVVIQGQFVKDGDILEEHHEEKDHNVVVDSTTMLMILQPHVVNNSPHNKASTLVKPMSMKFLTRTDLFHD